MRRWTREIGGGNLFHQSVMLGSDLDVKGCKSEVLTELVWRVHLSLRIPGGCIRAEGVPERPGRGGIGECPCRHVETRAAPLSRGL